MKVCEKHSHMTGLPKRTLQIVSTEECELCSSEKYFNSHGITEHEAIVFRRGSG